MFLLIDFWSRIANINKFSMLQQHHLPRFQYMSQWLYHITKGLILFLKPDADGKCLIRHIKKTPVKSSQILSQALFVYGADLFKQDNGVFIKSLKIIYCCMCRQLCLCVYSARNRCNDYCRAVPVARIVGDDKYACRPVPSR